MPYVYRVCSILSDCACLLSSFPRIVVQEKADIVSFSELRRASQLTFAGGGSCAVVRLFRWGSMASSMYSTLFEGQQPIEGFDTVSVLSVCMSCLERQCQPGKIIASFVCTIPPDGYIALHRDQHNSAAHHHDKIARCSHLDAFFVIHGSTRHRAHRRPLLGWNEARIASATPYSPTMKG